MNIGQSETFSQGVELPPIQVSPAKTSNDRRIEQVVPKRSVIFSQDLQVRRFNKEDAPKEISSTGRSQDLKMPLFDKNDEHVEEVSPETANLFRSTFLSRTHAYFFPEWERDSRHKQMLQVLRDPRSSSSDKKQAGVALKAILKEKKDAESRDEESNE